MKRRKFIKNISLLVLGIFTTGGLVPILKNFQRRTKGNDEANLEPPLAELLNELGINSPSPIRPPGAVDESKFKSRCIGCNACTIACHIAGFNAISTKFGLNDYGSVLVKDMRNFPCTLCMECVNVCPTSALGNIPKDKVKMGMALIDFSICLGWNGDICLSCSKACPFGNIVFDFYNSEWGNQPYINEKCVGCGLCVKYCPVGGSAIKVLAIDDYKKVKNKYIETLKKLLEMSSEERYEIVYNINIPKLIARGRIAEREYR